MVWMVKLARKAMPLTWLIRTEMMGKCPKDFVGVEVSRGYVHDHRVIF